MGRPVKRQQAAILQVSCASLASSCPTSLALPTTDVIELPPQERVTLATSRCGVPNDVSFACLLRKGMDKRHHLHFCFSCGHCSFAVCESLGTLGNSSQPFAIVTTKIILFLQKSHTTFRADICTDRSAAHNAAKCRLCSTQHHAPAPW